jgi:hypothetical protein
MSEEKPKDGQITPGWRFYSGIILFILGLLSPLFIPLVTATGLSAGWKTALSGLLMLGIPELLWVAAAAIMGKAGFNFIKGKFWGFFKKMAPPNEVGLARYRIGLVMFFLPILFGWLAPYGVHRLPEYEDYRFAANLTGDLLLVSSLLCPFGKPALMKNNSLFFRAADAMPLTGRGIHT